jgi:sugar fermentation stimulation protein A
MALIPDAQPVMLYFINRSDCTHFAPGTKYDRTYSDLFSQALEKGVKILPCRFAVTPQGISYLGLAELLRDS